MQDLTPIFNPTISNSEINRGKVEHGSTDRLEVRCHAATGSPAINDIEWILSPIKHGDVISHLSIAEFRVRYKVM
jgi:hypothetical protein